MCIVVEIHEDMHEFVVRFVSGLKSTMYTLYHANNVENALLYYTQIW